MQLGVVGNSLSPPPKKLMCIQVSQVYQTENKRSKNFDERLHRVPCRYSGLNDPFCCVRRSRDNQCYLMGRTASKIAPHRGDLDLHLT